jgi:hypothetical protein
MDLLACLCVCVCGCLSNMDLLLWARKCSESLMLGSCNKFAVTADKGPCLVHGLAGMPLYVCVCVCVCVYLSWTCHSGRESAANVSFVVVVIISP